MKKTVTKLPSGHLQSGAALIVGLILLMVLTMLGISGLQGSTFELLQAGNAQFSESAFQAAETGIDRALNRGGLNTVVPVIVPATEVVPGSVNTFQTETRFAQVTSVPQGLYSIGSSGGFQAFHFDIDSTGRSARNAVSVHSQSFYVIGPGN